MAFEVSVQRAIRKLLGANAGTAGQHTGSPAACTASPTRSSAALTRPITSPGQASSAVLRSRPTTVWAYLVASVLPVRPQVMAMPRSNRPEHTRRNAMLSRWAGSMLDCTLNTAALNPASTGWGSPPASRRAPGGGAISTMASRSIRTP